MIICLKQISWSSEWTRFNYLILISDFNHNFTASVKSRYMKVVMKNIAQVKTVCMIL